MSSLNPGAKFLSILITAIVLSLSYRTKTNIIVAIAALVLTLTYRGLNYRRLILILGPFVLTAFGFFMTALLFADESANFTGTYGKSEFNVNSMATAWLLSTRIMAFGCLAILFTLTTEPEAFFRSLRQQFKLSSKFAFGLLASYHFLPTIRGEYFMVRAAARVRGVRVWPLSPRLIIPILVRAFRRADNLAMAMESRGFNPLAPRGQAITVPLRVRDALFMLFPVLAVI
ncbi:MAG: energy-coupling factor transporter transmembrane protein EcfT [Deltaproteobacteria bacterium]|jgi:energy-coupling factor transport system permease protein|nr:energy-coupling factor transporter transmembrane protein EcfT [Deltaproteobacteria bacterium]